MRRPPKRLVGTTRPTGESFPTESFPLSLRWVILNKWFLPPANLFHLLRMHYRVLGRTGLKVPVLSFGGSSLGGAFRATDESEALRTVQVALELGMNYL